MCASLSLLLSYTTAAMETNAHDHRLSPLTGYYLTLKWKILSHSSCVVVSHATDTFIF